MKVSKTSFIRIGIGSALLVLSLSFSCSSPPSNYIILCAGDSLTEVGYPPFLARILKEEGIGAKVVNQGKSGHNSGEYLAFLEKNKKSLAQNFPDFICLQLGTNDVRTDHDHTSADAFYANMKEIIRLFKEFRTRSGKTPRLLIATVPPIPDNTPFPFDTSSEERVEREINPLIQKIAEEEKCALVDNFSLFVDSPLFLPEVHPSGRGYEAMAQNWRTALKKHGVYAPDRT